MRDFSLLNERLQYLFAKPASGRGLREGDDDSWRERA